MSSLSSLGPIALEQVTAVPGHWSYNEGGGEGACWRGWSCLQICAPLRLKAQTHRSLEFRVPFSSHGFSCCSSPFPSESFSLAVAATNLSIALHNTPTSRPRQSPQYETCRRIALQGARRICKALGWFEQQKILRVLQRKSTCANTLKKVRFQPKFPVLFCFPHFQNQRQTRALHLDSSKMVTSVITKDVASFDIGFVSSLPSNVPVPYFALAWVLNMEQLVGKTLKVVLMFVEHMLHASYWAKYNIKF